MCIQGDWWSSTWVVLTLDWVSHHLAQPVLLNSNLTKHNLAGGGVMKIKSTKPMNSTTRVTLYSEGFQFLLTC